MYRLSEYIVSMDIGGKAASLNYLFSLKDINVPDGFVLSSKIYRDFIIHNNIEIPRIETEDIDILADISKEIKAKFYSSRFPKNVEDEIYTFYDILNCKVAVRSSSLGEDGHENSFAGQQDTYLNVNREDLISSIISCYASLFNVSAISYRNSRGEDFQMAVVVQSMVNAEKSGVAFSIDTESGFDKVIIINSNFGLGESVVSGETEPDEYIFFKPTETIISKKLGSKYRKTVYSAKRTELVVTEDSERNKYSLSEEESTLLGKTVLKLEREKGFPIDVEFAFAQDKLYILQVRPETTIKKTNTIKKFRLETTESPICSGVAVGQKIATGKVCIKHNVDKNFKKGDILVARITSPDFEPILKMASGIITETGGRTCHAAIVARELGIPAIVGCENCLDVLKDGQEITISCVSEIGSVYSGKLEYQVDEIDITDIYEKVKSLPVKLKINAGFPDSAFSTAYLPTDGVGLTRLEFIISSIGVHPRSLLEYDSLPDDLQIKIDGIVGDDSLETRRNYYINGISNGVSKIAASVYPHEVIVRFSDFKTNEYRNLLGGELFEGVESNAMIGYRGCCRYYSSEFSESFKMECLAIEDVRNKKGLKNVAVMLPFCRTIEELLKVKKIIAEFELADVKLYLMCEIPSNVILAEEFAEHIDGFSIGSNDLTQLTLGLDRDNATIKHVGDERDPAVKKLIGKVIRKSHKVGKTVGICGTAPSDHKNFAQFLVEQGIDSISVTPDAFVQTVNSIYDLTKNIH